MRTIKLTVAYDGTEFVGWQRQAKGVSVQGLIEEALRAIDGAPVTLHGAGRTDSGVHALGQVATARVTSPIGDTRLARALNAHLPESIRITELTRCRTISTRGSARCRRPTNTASGTRRRCRPFIRLYAWHIMEPLDIAAMREATRAVVGEHDFAAFRSARSVNHTTVREITSAGWTTDGAALRFEIEGRGFLRYMVRSLVGTLVEVGRGARPAADMARLLASGDRSAAGRTAPALGLFLVKVDY